MLKEMFGGSLMVNGIGVLALMEMAAPDPLRGVQMCVLMVFAMMTSSAARQSGYGQLSTARSKTGYMAAPL